MDSVDPFPYSGGLTTLEALWMGVPVITLAGERFCSRHSLPHLSAVALDHLATNTECAYRATARELAADIDVLSVMRSNLRRRIAESSLCNGPGFAARLEAAFNEMWRVFREGAPLPG